MPKFSHDKVLRGTFGKVWVDDERMANLKGFEAKATIDYEDMDINGEFGKRKRFMGYSISGTMTLHKFDSFIVKKVHAGLQSGELPELKLVAALDDPQSYGAERVALYDVCLDELTLAKFENKGLVEEEVPFTAGRYEFLDLI